jgi:hypothetical protein
MVPAYGKNTIPPQKIQPVLAKALRAANLSAFRFKLNFTNFMPFCGG